MTTTNEVSAEVRAAQVEAWERGLNTGISYGRVMHILPEPSNPYLDDDEL